MIRSGARRVKPGAASNPAPMCAGGAGLALGARDH